MLYSLGQRGGKGGREPRLRRETHFDKFLLEMEIGRIHE